MTPPIGKANEANPGSLKEFFSEYYVTHEWQVGLQLVQIGAAEAFSHTDSRLLTVTVFQEFIPLYRTVQLILMKEDRCWKKKKRLEKGWGD